MTAPGDWRVWQALKASAQAARLGLELELRDDRHSYTMVREFAAHAKGRSTVRLEYFYRALRQRHGVLLHDGAPLGGQWNVDADKREAFGAAVFDLLTRSSERRDEGGIEFLFQPRQVVIVQARNQRDRAAAVGQDEVIFIPANKLRGRKLLAGD